MQTDSSVFIDTWGWLALGHRADDYHQIVKEIYQQLRQAQVQIYRMRRVGSGIIN